MKQLLLLLLFMFTLVITSAQQTLPVEGYGEIYISENDAIMLDLDKEHNALFDIMITAREKGKVNPLLNAVARYINLHAAKGLSVDRMNITVVFHGRATKDGLTNDIYKSNVQEDNPNIELIEKLSDCGVEFYICAQSLNAYGFKESDYLKEVKISPSAMTALIYFQEKGYHLIDFN